MKPLVLGVLQDLRERRLLAPAAFLAVALIAVPVLLYKPKQEPATPAAQAPVGAPAGAEGLPTPEQALQADGKPLVTLASLEQPSTLSVYRTRNPFKPLDELKPGGDAPTGANLASTGGGAQSKSGSAAPNGGGGGVQAPSGSGGGTTPTDPGTPPTTPDTKAPQKFTYALDATLDGPRGLRRYRNMTRLTMLPSETDPLLVFLGVTATGEKAVFLVDSTVKLGTGEGSCSPSRAQCATLALEPGERQEFFSANGDRYVLQIDQIDERSLASISKAAKAARKRKRLQARTSVGNPDRMRRFVPPVLADIVTGVQQ